MKKRLISLNLAILMLLSLIPVRVVLALDSVAVDDEHFPDAAFRSYVSECFDSDGDGSLSQGELDAVTYINVHNRGISSLQGVEFFTALTYLSCYGNQLTTLDVSKNTVLTELYCGNNQLTALDVSENTALAMLSCRVNELTTLDISKNTALTSLFCHHNGLMTLDTSNNIALADLYCENNELTDLDISNNIALTRLSCGNNQLTSLDISKNTALTSLWCEDNQLTSLDLSTNHLLSDIDCRENRLSTLTLPTNDKGKRWYVTYSSDTGYSNTEYGYPASSLHEGGETLSVENGIAIRIADYDGTLIYNNNMSGDKEETSTYYYNSTSPASLRLHSGDELFENSPEGYSFNGWNSERDGNGTFFSKIGKFLSGINTIFAQWLSDDSQENTDIDEDTFPDANFRAYVSASLDKDGNGKLSPYERDAVTEIYVGGESIQSLQGVELFTTLTYLYCRNNQLTTLDVSKNTALTRLDCYNNELTDLDISNNTALTSLDCRNNQLTALDVSKNTALTSLDCYNNELTALDVSNNTALTYLSCGDNQLTRLDTSKCKSLTSVDCCGNLNIAVTLPSSVGYGWYGSSQPLYFSDTEPQFFEDGSCAALKNSGICLARSDQIFIVSIDKNCSDGTEQKRFYTSRYYYPVDGFSTIFDNPPAGMELVSWNTEADGSGKEYELDSQIIVVDGLVLYAQWRAEDRTGGVKINETNFPDDHFRSCVSEQADLNKNGFLTQRELETADDLQLGHSEIASLQGIEYFSNLERLYCQNNRLTSLDLSCNTLLTDLYCSNNMLAALDIGSCSRLCWLDCEGNQLTHITLPQDSGTWYVENSEYGIWAGYEDAAFDGGTEITVDGGINLTTYCPDIDYYNSYNSSVTYHRNTSKTDEESETYLFRVYESSPASLTLYQPQDLFTDTPSDRTFAGWNTKQDGSGTFFDRIGSFIKGAFDLFAQWVKNGDAARVKLNKNRLTLSVGKISTLEAAVLPENAVNKSVTWKSSDSSVASVLPDGTVKAIKAGTATITAMSDDGNYTDTCFVTVTDAAFSCAVSFNYFMTPDGEECRSIPDGKFVISLSLKCSNDAAVDVMLAAYNAENQFIGMVAQDTVSGNMTVRLTGNNTRGDIATLKVFCVSAGDSVPVSRVLQFD